MSEIIKTIEIERRSELYGLIELVQRAVSTDKTRTQLQLMWILQEDPGYLMATDGKQLHKLELDTTVKSGPLSDRSWMPSPELSCRLSKEGLLAFYQERCRPPNWKRVYPKQIAWYSFTDHEKRSKAYIDLSKRAFNASTSLLNNAVPEPLHLDALKRLSTSGDCHFEIGREIDKSKYGSHTYVFRKVGTYFEAILAPMYVLAIEERRVS